MRVICTPSYVIGETKFKCQPVVLTWLFSNISFFPQTMNRCLFIKNLPHTDFVITAADNVESVCLCLWTATAAFGQGVLQSSRLPLGILTG